MKAPHPGRSSRERIAVVGMGASSLYLLKNLLVRADTLSAWIDSLVLFERTRHPGVGMPYSPATTDRHNICNITSQELPALKVSFADWLRGRSDTLLARFGIRRESISDSETYPRLALGAYFAAQCRMLIEELRARGIRVDVRMQTPVRDIRDLPDRDAVAVVADGGEEAFSRVVIATGHAWPPEDQPDNGYFASPWPIQKLFPKRDELHDFAIGTLGASLSAFDVITSLAHRHGRFDRNRGRLRFIANEDAQDFRFIMHSANGRLPHLQYEQSRSFREVYRPINRRALLALRQPGGLLRLDTYFDHVCRPALAAAFDKDGRADVAARLRDPSFTLEAFVSQMSEEHTYDDAFEGLRAEYPEAEHSVRRDAPIHWKETLDDVVYTLSYHAELLSAGDHLRLKRVLMPFVMNVIASLPLKSADILLALHESGRLELVAGNVTVRSREGGKTTIEIENDGRKTTASYRLFIDCSGQPPVDIERYPFRSLVEAGTVRAARVPFADEKEAKRLCEDGSCQNGEEGNAYRVPGIDIDASYRVIDTHGNAHPRIHDIAFPHTAGLRPYSYGLQACNHTAGIVVETWHAEATAGTPPPSSTQEITKLQARVANE